MTNRIWIYLILVAAFTYGVIAMNDAERRADKCESVKVGRLFK